MRTRAFGVLMGLLALGAAQVTSCDSGTAPLKSNVQVSFATRRPAAAPGWAGAPAVAGVAGSDTLSDGTNTLIITRAQIVLRRIKLERLETTSCTTQPAGCEDVEVGPVLVDLPLGPGAEQKFSVSIPTGTYDKIEFEIHKVSSEDPAALQQVLLDKSIRVEGVFNGAPFAYESDLDVEQELSLVPALAVSDTTTAVNVTIRVLLEDWFRSSSGTLLDPATGNKGGPNEGVIKDNIKRSMEAFEDRDRDGKSDR